MSKGQIERTPNGAQFAISDADYAKAKKTGKVFSGLANVLNMEPGQRTGPWEVVSIDNRKLDKKYDAVDVVTAECKGVQMAMPAATSFREKAQKAGLKIGDTFITERGDDYRARGKDCQSYSIIVLSQK